MQGAGSTHRRPRWVKLTGILAIALLLLFVGLHLIGMRLLGHVPGGDGDHAPPPSATEHGMQHGMQQP
jgi:hypothetical protein